MNTDDAADLLRINDLRRILGDDSIVIDVGAHVGEFSAAIRNISNASINAFKPVPDAFSSRKNNLSDEKFFPINSASALENDYATFHITESLVGSSLLPPIKGQTSKWLNETTAIKVKTIRLDTFIERQKFTSISLLKTDAEGYDLRVLESVGNFLKPSFVQAALVEMSFYLFHEGQDKFYKAIELLTEKGYFLAGFYHTIITMIGCGGQMCFSCRIIHGTRQISNVGSSIIRYFPHICPTIPKYLIPGL